ncbi:MAG: hypothetical protein HYR83_05650 [Planctomycetes bacterium]|nr:hypothetical protein [Planctomycetota bacterium]
MDVVQNRLVERIQRRLSASWSGSEQAAAPYEVAELEERVKRLRSATESCMNVRVSDYVAAGGGHSSACVGGQVVATGGQQLPSGIVR